MHNDPAHHPYVSLGYQLHKNIVNDQPESAVKTNCVISKKCPKISLKWRMKMVRIKIM
jgi:hypothetical protein